MFHPYLRNTLFLLIAAVGFASASFAQTATVRGFVEDDEGNPVPFTNVYLDGTSYGVATNDDGYYSIVKVPKGSYTLMVSSLDHDTLREPITLRPNQVMTRKLVVTKGGRNLKTVEISAEKQTKQVDTRVSVTTIDVQDIKKIPGVGGENDIAQYFQVLPGVIFTGDQGGQLYIRGGSPIQNKVLLDGMIIYNPFHSIGLFSVFETDIIRKADVHTGGFNAEYGGRISSVMDITTRDGNKNRFAGKAGVSTFGAKMLLEGPLKKPNKPGGSSISYIASAKTSYLRQSSEIFYDYVSEDGLPFNFTDLYGKVSINGANGSKVNFFGFRFTDQVNYQAVSDLGWTNAGGGGNFVLVPGGSPVLIEGNFSYSQYEIALEEANLPPRSSGINGFNFGLDFTYFQGLDELKYGIEVLGFGTQFNFFNALDRKIEQDQNTTELAGYLKYKKTIGNLILEPSFRAHYYASLTTVSPEPRFAAKYNATDNLRFKVAGGLYSQNLISGVSDRDVVNLFYGFLSGPDNLQDEFTSENGETREVTHKLQKAWHAIAGTEIDITNSFSVNVEGYYKLFTQLTNLNRNKIFDDDERNFDRPDILKKDFIIEEGNAYGIDFVFKYELKQIYLWAVYSLGVVNRWDGITDYHPIFDRRHNVNLVGSYTFGKQRNWEFNARWNFGSGFPFTQTAGVYEKFPFTDGIGTDYTTQNGELSFIYGDLSGGRLPTYHRLDLTLKRIVAVSENSILEMNLGVTNAYDRQNIFYVDRVSNERVDQLPIMPSFGMSMTF